MPEYLHNPDYMLFLTIKYWLEYVSLYWFTDMQLTEDHMKTMAIMKKFYIKFEDVERFNNISYRYSFLYIDAFHKNNRLLDITEVQDDFRARYNRIINIPNFDLKLSNHLNSIVLVFTKNLDTLFYKKQFISIIEWQERYLNKLKFVELITHEWFVAKEKCFRLKKIDFNTNFNETFVDYIVLHNFITYVEHFILGEPFDSSFEEIKFREFLWMEFELNYFLELKHPFRKTEQWLRCFIYDEFHILKLRTIDTITVDTKLKYTQIWENYYQNLNMKRKLVQLWHPKKYLFW